MCCTLWWLGRDDGGSDEFPSLIRAVRGVHVLCAISSQSVGSLLIDCHCWRCWFDCSFIVFIVGGVSMVVVVVAVVVLVVSNLFFLLTVVSDCF